MDKVNIIRDNSTLKKFCNKKLYKNSFDSWGKL